MGVGGRTLFVRRWVLLDRLQVVDQQVAFGTPNHEEWEPGSREGSSQVSEV